MTPAQTREMQVTPHHYPTDGGMSMRSPTTTPLNIGGNYQNTPMHFSSTPKYQSNNMASPMGSSYYGLYNSGARSPHLMGSSSPDYSLRSSGGMSGPSPSYNYSPSPYSSSPNYSSQDSDRKPNIKDEDQ